MGCQNQHMIYVAQKDGIDPAKLKQQWWGQGSSSKCLLILTAALGSLKLHKVHSLQVNFWWGHSAEPSHLIEFKISGFLLFLPLSLIYCSDQFLHQTQKSWKES